MVGDEVRKGKEWLWWFCPQMNARPRKAFAGALSDRTVRTCHRPALPAPSGQDGAEAERRGKRSSFPAFIVVNGFTCN